MQETKPAFMFSMHNFCNNFMFYQTFYLQRTNIIILYNVHSSHLQNSSLGVRVVLVCKDLAVGTPIVELRNVSVTKKEIELVRSIPNIIGCPLSATCLLLVFNTLLGRFQGHSVYIQNQTTCVYGRPHLESTLALLWSA